MASSDPHRREPNNLLRIDLYKHLLERVREEDQASGVYGYVLNWDDPAFVWDTGDPADVWDALGFRPAVQSLFYVIETLEGEDIGWIESLDDIVDPFRAPAEMLPFIAASLGYDLEESLAEEERRQVVSGLVRAFKTSGQDVGFRVFYRMAGFRVIRIYPLWKQGVNEDQSRYSREQYETTPVPSESIGLAGGTAYAGRLAETPVKPGSIRITDGSITLRDNVPPVGLVVPREAELIGPGGETGTVDYQSGQYTVTLSAPAAGAVTASYDRIDATYPYHAARIDIELLLNPGGDLVNPVPLVDAEVVRNILTRAEEARPVHVLLRALALVSELHDEFSPGATDQQACVTKVKDVREGSPHLFVPGRDYTYMLDFVPDIAPEDDLAVEEVSGGVRTGITLSFEDRAALACPMDVLTIDGPPGGPIYA